MFAPIAAGQCRRRMCVKTTSKLRSTQGLHKDYMGDTRIVGMIENGTVYRSVSWPRLPGANPERYGLKTAI